MNGEDLLTALLACETAEAQREYVQAHQAYFTLEVFEGFKARSDQLALKAPPQAMAIAAATILAASVANQPAVSAIAHWARGNAWLVAGNYPQALADYERACAAYQGLDPVCYRLEIGRLQSNLVSVHKNLGRYEAALALADTARVTLQPWAETRYVALLEMNVGSIHRLQGRYAEALAAYERGRSIFATLADAVQVAQMDINIARLLVNLDRFPEAELRLHTSQQALTAHEAALPAARAALNLATLHSRQGRHRQALDEYGQVRAAFATMGDAADVATTDLYMAIDYLALNLLPEAIERAALARATFSQLQMPRHIALALKHTAIAERKLGHYREALSLLAEACALLVERDAVVEVALLAGEQALCHQGLDEWEVAATVAEPAVRVLTAHNLPLAAAQAQMILAESYLRSGQIARSADLYAATLTALEGLPSLAWQARAGLGDVAYAQGDRETALRHYQQAIADIEATEDALRLTDYRAGFVADKLSVYQYAVAIALELTRPEAAFQWAAQSKSGVWRTALAQASTSDTVPSQITQLRQQWHWLYHRLTRQEEEAETVETPPPAPDKRGAAMQTHWEALRAVERQLLQARRDHQDSVALLPHPTLSAVQGWLPANGVLLDYYCTAETVNVFVIRPHQVEVVAPLAALRDVEPLLNHWRFNLESVRLGLFAGRPVLALAEQVHTVLQGLYALLVAPLENYLEGCDTLWLSPHAGLWEIPFAALPAGEFPHARYLVEQYALAYWPGWAGASQGTARVAQSETTAVAAAPLVVGYSDAGRLVYAVTEAQAVHRALGAGQVLLEEAATLDQVQRAAATATLLHLATHGLFRADAPLFSALHLADGALTAEQLETWDLSRVNLVTLSACETGISLSWGSDLLGLARGFWRAGARRLLVSQWAVDDAATAELMTHFYTQLQTGHSPARALRAAQMTALAKYRHPFYWAGFTLLTLGN